MSETFNIPNRNVGYQYVFKENDEQTYIGIKGGPYEGVIYKYGEITIPQDENPDGTMPFKFKYDIADNNGIKKEEFTDDFFSLMGDILVDIIDREEYVPKST
tara:strand:+ start:603 stop:908 length:306 start_codon:yes stop_codon:yes gene_type:complete